MQDKDSGDTARERVADAASRVLPPDDSVEGVHVVVHAGLHQLPQRQAQHEPGLGLGGLAGGGVEQRAAHVAPIHDLLFGDSDLPPTDTGFDVLRILFNHVIELNKTLKPYLSKLIAQSSENTINSYLQAVTHVT